MVEPTFNTEDIDEFLDHIRIAKLKAEMRGQQQQIDRPSVVTIRRLEAENAKLKEALREMMEATEATEAVDEWKSGEAPSFLGGYAFDLVKSARTKAREVLDNKKEESK